MLHLWIKIGIQPIWLRFLSVLFSIFSVAGFVVLNRLIFGEKASLTAGLIVAVLPSEIRYAQEVGEYALMGCTLIWSLVFLSRTYKISSWTNCLLWGLFSILSIYSQYGATIIIVTSSAFSLLENLKNKRKKFLLKQIIVVSVSLAIILPLLFFFPEQLNRQVSDVSFLPFTSVKAEVNIFLESIGNTLLYFLTLYQFSSLPKWLTQIASYLILSFLLLLLTRSSRVYKRTFWWFLSVYFVYFLAVRLSLYAHGAFGWRYSIILTPLFILLITATIETLKKCRQSILACILFFTFFGLAGYQIGKGNTAWPETQENLRPIFSYWMNSKAGGDKTYVYYGAVPGFQYYRSLFGVEDDGIFDGEWFRSLTTEEKLNSITKTLGGEPERLWLVFSHVYSMEEQEILEGLSDSYNVTINAKSLRASCYLLLKNGCPIQSH